MPEQFVGAVDEMDDHGINVMAGEKRVERSVLEARDTAENKGGNMGLRRLC
jgi:hypothetical protein